MVDNENIEHRVAKIETKVEEHDKRFDKVDTSLQRIWERMDQNRDQQVRTQTLVEIVDKRVTDVHGKLDKVEEGQQTILEHFNNYRESSAAKSADNWKYAFWFVLGSIGTLVGTLLIAHFVHL